MGGHLTPGRLTTQCTWERNSWDPADTIMPLYAYLKISSAKEKPKCQNVRDKHSPQNVCCWVEQVKLGHVRAFLIDGYFPFFQFSVYKTCNLEFARTVCAKPT